jgi:hypothetical protein
MEAIIAFALVASLCIYTSGISVAIVATIIDTLIDILAVALPRGSKESFPTHAQSIGTFRTFPQNNTAFGIGCASLWTSSCRSQFVYSSCLRGKRTIGDTVSDKVFVANANCRVVRRYLATCILMANKTDAHIPRNTLNGSPLEWHVLRDVASVGENGIIAGEAPTFEFLWRVVVDTE